jgi:5-formyltetrahydrofolate cyclo-ligase
VTKVAWRARLSARRRAMPANQLRAAAGAMRNHLIQRLSGTACIAAYVPIGAEPGSVDLLDALGERGTTVLIPVLAADRLDWAVYAGPAGLATDRFGLREPVGPRLGPAALALADVVLVPALAVDYRGWRLGRGAGYYDRALGDLPAVTPIAALLHDGELVPELPTDPWDRAVTAAVTPADGWTELPLLAHHGN